MKGSNVTWTCDVLYEVQGFKPDNFFIIWYSFKKVRKIYHRFSFRILGFLKAGRKRLFVHDRRGVCVECVPLCVLDFYVHEAHQRKGCGKKLFDFMLKVSVSAMSCHIPLMVLSCFGAIMLTVLVIKYFLVQISLLFLY